MTARDKIAAALEADVRRRRGIEERERRESIGILAAEFGRMRGWLRSSTPFSLEQLRTRSNKIQEGNSAFNLESIFYRDRERPNRPVAIGSLVYGWTEARADIEAICARFVLHCELVTDFPSWAEGAQLVVFTPMCKPALATLKRRKVKTCPEQRRLF